MQDETPHSDNVHHAELNSWVSESKEKGASRGSRISRRITDGALEHQGTKESSGKGLDAGAWLQYQQGGMPRRNERELERSGHLQGELTPVECPLIPPTHTSSAPLHPQQLAGGLCL